jgi:hypothetical protein
MGRSTSTYPASGARAVTTSDSTMLPNGTCRGLYIGVTGDVTVLTADGDTATFKAVPVGPLHIQCQRVNSTATTATNILALY